MPGSPLRRTSIALVSALIALFPAMIHAQDTRHVVEPHLPPACVTLMAHLSAPNGKLTAPEEQQEDTARIQQAIDHCTPGDAVELRSSGKDDIFLSGPLQLRRGITLRVDSGTALYGSRNPRDYDLTPGSCGVVNRRGHGCKPLITADHAPGSGVMGNGVIDGRGGATLLGQKVTWWDLAHEAKIRDLNQSCPRILVIDRSNNFTLYRITLRNSPNFHVLINHTNGFTAWGVRIDTPATARNTDGIDPAASENVTITHSYIRDGDDDVAIKAGTGGPSSHMTISDDHFYSGHGMSIGSETNGGVRDILVENLTLDGTTNGIRIKSDLSRGGLVDHVTYRNICMRNVKHPILLTPHYARKHGTLVPEYRDILLQNVHILTRGDYTLLGEDAAHPLAVQFDNVWADELSHSRMQTAFAHFTLGPGLGNFVPASGDGVTIAKMQSHHPGMPPACANSFPAFPVNTSVPPSAGTIPQDHALYVSKDSTGEYHTLQSAIDAAPAAGATIHIAPGTYREAIVIDKPNIHLIGGGPDPSSTVIVDDKSAGTSGGTLQSATVTVRGNGFFAANLTIANDWNRTHAQASQGSQAVALAITADKAILTHVRLLGNQDTLYAGSRKCSAAQTACTTARQLFSHCTISGNVDFIFGNSKAYFQHCTLISTPHSEGMITAQSKDAPQQDSAFVFDHCRLLAEPGVTNVWLGRPWRPYATVVFLHTLMGPQIAAAGWREWHPGVTHSLATAWFAEFGSTGPGANPAAREPYSHQLTASQANRFTLAHFFPTWRAAADLQRLLPSLSAVQ
uniref:Endopolygalacturonase n=1 Tax=Acidobacterium capsulatum TaxID=33075 RepID=A0A7V5CTY9_9BACT